MWFLPLYHLAWSLLALALFPLLPFLRNERFLERTARRLPFVPPRKGNIWVHALSAGEVLSAVSFVDALKEKYPDREIVFTVTTRQGMEIARRELGGKVNMLLTMPMDFWWCVRRIVSYIRPSLFLLIETDLWPGLNSHLRRKGIRRLLINGRISPRTFRAYRRFRCFSRPLLGGMDLILMQSDLDTRRLLHIGIGKEHIRTTGNIKFDWAWAPVTDEEQGRWRKNLNLERERPVWIAGSTHKGEEGVILDVFGRLSPLFPSLCLIIAPRRVEESEALLSLGIGRGFETVLRTRVSTRSRPYDMLILDTVGELAQIYSLGRVSFVGGTLIPMGGHNLLEPARFGQPVLFGPYTHNFVFMSQMLIEAGGGKRIADGDELFEILRDLLSDPRQCEAMGNAARRFAETNRGALTRVMDYIG